MRRPLATLVFYAALLSGAAATISLPAPGPGGKSVSAALTFTSLANGTVGGSAIAGSGAYTGTAPTGISSATWGGGCSGSSTVSGFTAGSGVWSASFTTPAGAGTGCTIAATDNRSDSATSPGVTISSSGPWTLVAATQLVGSSSGGTTAAINCTGANLIVIPVQFFTGGGATISSLTDSSGNTYTVRGSPPGVNQATITVADKISPSVSSSMTFTLAGTGIFATMTVMCFHDTTGTPTFDTIQTNDAPTGSTSLQAGASAITPGANNALVISGLSTGGTGTPTVNSGFTIAAQLPVDGGVYESGSGAYLVQATAAAINPIWSWSGSGDAGSLVMDYKP